jgi:hypothetical protein
MADTYQKDESAYESTVAHMHPVETIPQGTQADSAEGNHEHRDVSFRALSKWFTGLFALIVVSMVVVWATFRWVVGHEQKFDSVPSATFASRPDLDVAWPVKPMVSPLQKPGEVPTLLPEPEVPLKVFRVEEDKTLNSYNWAKDAHGRKTGAVTIPVSRAIELTAQRGLPSENRSTLRPDLPVSPVVRTGAPHN